MPAMTAYDKEGNRLFIRFPKKMMDGFKEIPTHSLVNKIDVVEFKKRFYSMPEIYRALKKEYKPCINIY